VAGLQKIGSHDVRPARAEWRRYRDACLAEIEREGVRRAVAVKDLLTNGGQAGIGKHLWRVLCVANCAVTSRVTCCATRETFKMRTCRNEETLKTFMAAFRPSSPPSCESGKINCSQGRLKSIAKATDIDTIRKPSAVHH
jgi:hypothetical protein